MFEASPWPLPAHLAEADRLVICLAGNATPPTVFSQALAERSDVTAVGVDYLASDGPWTVEAIAGRVAGLISRRESPTYLIGHSAGGLIALCAAASHHGSRLAGLVVSSTGPDVAEHAGRAASPVSSPAAAEGDHGMARMLFGDCDLTPVHEAQIDEYLDGLPPAPALELYADVRRVDLTAMLPRIVCPTVIVHGNADARRPPSDGERLARAIPGSTLFTMDANHFPMLDNPHGFAQAVATAVPT